jgi:hypothetical protein
MPAAHLEGFDGRIGVGAFERLDEEVGGAAFARPTTRAVADLGERGEKIPREVVAPGTSHDGVDRGLSHAGRKVRLGEKTGHPSLRRRPRVTTGSSSPESRRRESDSGAGCREPDVRSRASGVSGTGQSS